MAEGQPWVAPCTQAASVVTTTSTAPSGEEQWPLNCQLERTTAEPGVGEQGDITACAALSMELLGHQGPFAALASPE